jgi:hypothetical protein
MGFIRGLSPVVVSRNDTSYPPYVQNLSCLGTAFDTLFIHKPNPLLGKRFAHISRARVAIFVHW